MNRERKIITVMALAIAASLFWGPAWADELLIFYPNPSPTASMSFTLTSVKVGGVSLAELTGDYPQQKSFGYKAQKNEVLKGGEQLLIMGTYKPFPQKETQVEFDFTIPVDHMASTSFQRTIEGYSGGGGAEIFRTPSSEDNKRWGLLIIIPAG